jgi:hypothetical protein
LIIPRHLEALPSQAFKALIRGSKHELRNLLNAEVAAVRIFLLEIENDLGFRAVIADV